MSKEGESIRRRRECLSCGYRYTTYEGVEEQEVRVIKSDGRYEPFDKNKLMGGIVKACEKRPVSRDRIEGIVLMISSELQNVFDKEIPTHAIGEKVMEKLRATDGVAYVRFASVYREFKEVADFEKEIRQLRQEVVAL